MLHLVPPQCGGNESDVLRAMFAARKAVFVDLLGWDVPVLVERFEVDQFDDEHAIYLVVTDARGRHQASARLLPATRPHILADLYASLCDRPVPRAHDIFEITRFCLDRRIDAAARRVARNQLILGLVDHALAHGIKRYTAVAEGGWLTQILDFGWRASMLGTPQEVGSRKLGALLIEIEPDTRARLEAAGVGAPPKTTREMRHVS
ncbi:acyl-homoserine-lactone synthase [Sphingopyxis sp. JAI128]|uniref:acyl-homoserine-lactone synthase n=1 Tax=Sphingopyxis sp. JAI128 TaxID=2723066 RepID=UPI0016084B32|nr:acyl-homoserine-lactone synthase [Sphingopyxis sp. JAI128]MBB6426976.1 acyl-homoserine lactone synthase [Sphingopyxis sp. JAI128]